MNRPMHCLIACALLGTVAAQAAPKPGGSVTLASNHLQRGLSRSNNDPALSVEVHAQTAAGAFASLWASTSRVRQADSTTVELAATLGFGGSLNEDWTLRGSYAHYESPWQRVPGIYRYDEFTLDLGFREGLLLSASYSPNTSRFVSSYGPLWRSDALTFEAAFQHELRPNLRGYAGAGYHYLSDPLGEGYWYGSIGLGWAWKRWRLDASYVLLDSAARRLSYPRARHSRPLVTLGFVF